MNIGTNKLILAALAALAGVLPSCVVPEGGYVDARARTYGPSSAYSHYSVTLADGYAGRGYYYGPPNVRYYERQPGIVYYRTREAVPQEYWSSHDGDGYRRSYTREVRTTTSVPTSQYTLRMGDGYAGRGYYYGPPNVRYYERAPGVVYYRDMNEVPRQYRTETSIRTGIGLDL